MNARPRRNIELNLPQLIAVHSTALKKWLEWGRGTGKSTILAWIIVQMIRELPRGKVAYSGTSFRSILSETLPSTKEGLERLGIYENLHYFVGKPGPKNWETPFQSPSDWANTIHFWTGFALQLVSQDKSSIERRGQNFDGVIVEEAAKQDEKRLFNEVIAGKRTNRREFLGKPTYLSETYVSTTPVTRAGLWFLKGEEQAMTDPQKNLFLSASARHNAHNLARDFFDNARKAAPSQMIYDAEIENIRPRLVVNGYYPMLKPEHYYGALDGDYYLQRIHTPGFQATCLGDMDVDPDLPLIYTFDPGAAINASLMKQLVPKRRELRTLKEFWRLSPSIIQDLVANDVIPYYAPHRCKVVYLFYDRTALNKQPNSRTTVVDDVEALFRAAGWEVIRLTTGRVINQDEKFHVIGKVMDEKDERMWKVRINRDNCPNLIVSLEHAEATEDGRGNVKKDKRSENRDGSVPRQHATDLSDAFDLPVFYYAKRALMGDDWTGGEIRTVGR